MIQSTVSRVMLPLVILLTMTCAPQSAYTQTIAGGAPAANALPVGTTINAQNWEQYRDFMPEGMARLFAGEFALKIPADVEMEIGPTEAHPPPKGYAEATEKYAS